MSEKLGISVKKLHKLIKKADLIQYVGSGNHGHWTINKIKNGTHGGTHGGTHELLTKIEELIIANNTISRREISEKLGISVRNLQRLINRADTIQYIGSGNHGYWKINNK